MSAPKLLHSDVIEKTKQELNVFAKKVTERIEGFKVDLDASTGHGDKQDKRKKEISKAAETLKNKIDSSTKNLSTNLKHIIDSIIGEARQQPPTHSDTDKHPPVESTESMSGDQGPDKRGGNPNTDSTVNRYKKGEDESKVDTAQQREVELKECYKEKDKLQKECSEQKKKAEDAQQMLISQNEEIKSLTSKKNGLQTDLKKERELKHKETEELNKRKDEFDTALKKEKELKHKEKEELNKRFLEFKKKAEESEEMLTSRNKEMKSLLEKNEQHLNKKEYELKELRDEIDKKVKEIKSLDTENARLKKEVKDLIRRIGTFASDKIQHDDPDVADLGDPDRALKLADRFNEFYAKTWTKEFMVHNKLNTRRDKEKEKEIVSNMLDAMKDSFAFCDKVASMQENSLRILLLHPIQDTDTDIRPHKSSEDIEPLLLFKMKDLRKNFSIAAKEEVIQACLDRNRTKQAEVKDDGGKATDTSISKEYYRKCVEVCWPMVLHNPPLYLEFDVEYGAKVNKDVYNLRSSGDFVERLVWPPLFLGKNGTLLSKGVVEATGTSTKQDD